VRRRRRRERERETASRSTGLCTVGHLAAMLRAVRKRVCVCVDTQGHTLFLHAVIYFVDEV